MDWVPIFLRLSHFHSSGSPFFFAPLKIQECYDTLVFCLLYLVISTMWQVMTDSFLTRVRTLVLVLFSDLFVACIIYPCHYFWIFPFGVGL